MTNKKSTKRALLLSALSLLLCISMLVGSTFAWFTDSVTSGKNKIQAGNLDVELEYYKGGKWNTVDKATDLFTGNLWEPGHAEVVYLKMSNLGSLALKYQLGINVASETASTSVATDKEFKLSDFIKFSVVGNVNGETAPFADRATAVAEALKVVDGNKKINAGYSNTGVMLAKQAPIYMALVVYMPESVGNEANYKKDAPVPTIELGVNLMATQKDYESDSFGIDYDAKASEVVTDITKLQAAINAAEEGGTVFIASGNYTLPAQINVNKSVNIVGLGNVTITAQTAWHMIMVSNYYGTTDEMVVNMQNINLDGNNKAKAGIYAKYNVDLTLNNVTVKGTTWDDIQIDNANTHSDGKYYNNTKTVVRANNVTVEDVSLIALPTAPSENTGVKYDNEAHFYYDPATCSIGKISKDARCLDQSNLYVNGDNVTTGIMIADGLWETAPNTYDITTPAGLVNLETAIPAWTSETYRTVNLKADLDMTGVAFEPLDKMFLHFNGNNHTISNLTVDGSKDWAGRSGLFAYLGGGSIKDLTLKNVSSTGSQAGTFIGHSEGGDLINCTLDGTNTVTWNTPSADKVGDGIGAFVGVTIESSSEYTGTIASGATVDMTKGIAGNQIAKTSVYAGGLYNNCAPTVTISNNGTITEAIAISSAEDWISLGATGPSHYQNKTYTLMQDIDFGGAELKPIGSTYDGTLTINGNGKTLSNFKLVSNDYWNSLNSAGLFFASTGSTLTVNDLKIDGVTVEAGDCHTAVLVGYADGNSNVVLNNVDVANATVASESNAAIYVGYTAGKSVTMTDCNITGICSVTGETGKNKAGAYAGTVNTATLTVTINNCTNNGITPVIGRNYSHLAKVLIDGADVSNTFANS